MFSAFPFLSLVIWVPILGGVWVLLLGEENRARNARFAALVVSLLDLRAVDPPLCRVRRDDGGDAVRGEDPLDPGLPDLLPPRGGRDLDAARPPHHVHHRARGGGRPGGHRAPRVAVHGLVPDPGGAHGGGVLRPRRDPLLRLLGGAPRPDVPHHRHLGRGEPGVRHHQVLPLHLPRLGPDAGRLPLPLRGGGELPDPRLPPRQARACRPRSSSSSRSSPRSRSRCRCGRCTPGSPTPTWRRRREGR